MSLCVVEITKNPHYKSKATEKVYFREILFMCSILQQRKEQAVKKAQNHSTEKKK